MNLRAQECKQQLTLNLNESPRGDPKLLASMNVALAWVA